MFLIIVTLTNGCRQREQTPAESAGNQQVDATLTLPTVGKTDSPLKEKNEPQSDLPSDRDTSIANAERFEEQGDLRGAESTLRSLLLVDPSDHEVVFRLASIAAARDDLDAAIELLNSIPEDDPVAGLPALGQAADWSFQLERYSDAERGYLKILESFPEATEAHRKLAYLLNRQGRRHEAAMHVRDLCRQGNVLQDELHSLIQLSDAMYDAPTNIPVNADERLYYPIGASGQARMLFTQERFQEAVDVLRESIDANQQPPSMVAFFGRAAAEAQDDASFNWWLGKVDADTQQFAEYWAAIGTYFWMQRKPAQAVRALLEAVDREPTDFRSIVRLRAALKALQRDEEAEMWSDRWKILRDISQQNNRIADATQPDVGAMANLAVLLDSIDRDLESVLWKLVAVHYQPAPTNIVQMLQAQLKQLVTSDQDIPDQGFPDRAIRLCGMQIDEFPIPPIDALSQDMPSIANNERSANSQAHPARFENVADSIGLEHAFHVASAPQDRGFSVYQSVGGAVAAIDYDLDGNPDLYLTQGGADPPDFVGNESNVLYRQVSGKLVDVTQAAGARQQRYSTGATVGDWNQDGFPDVMVANVGQNSLWLNAGDGTFEHIPMDDRDDKTVLTTSLAIADLNGDALPDVFELNYLHDPAFSKRPATNELGEVVGYLKPSEFNPAIDRVILNSASGIPSFQFVSESDSAAASGLGVIVGDFDDHHPGNEVFVGNDTDPNQLWVHGVGDTLLTDVAMSRGCAFGFDGVPTASMGVAAGDFDGNGSLDFHVTNFHDENVSLFMNQGGMFQDRNVGFALAGPSSSVLGFGTQAIDYDNDGLPDLVVANGHIEQSVAIRDPFEQPPQLFANLGNRFQLVQVDDPSQYWSGRHVGRGLARLDFNRDGQMDFAVTHLGETSALLLNRTETANHWLQLQLVGTQCERDAIGARVDLQIEGQIRSQWVLAGDGFFCRNEAVVAFGLGSSQSVQSLSIRWPSGDSQQLTDISADRRLLVIQGQPGAFELD